MHKRSLGYEAEILVKHHYEQAGRTCIQQNFTIRGGEVDLILTNNVYIVFIEVKSVNSRDSIHNYITYYKRKHLKKTIATYLLRYPISLLPRVDVVFVKGTTIYWIVEHCIDF